MTGYKSKRAAAQDKLDSMEREALKLALEKIATVNAMDYEYQAWAKEALAQPVQEPVVRWKFLERNQYEIASLVTQLIFIAVVIILGVLI